MGAERCVQCECMGDLLEMAAHIESLHEYLDGPPTERTRYRPGEFFSSIHFNLEAMQKQCKIDYKDRDGRSLLSRVGKVTYGNRWPTDLRAKDKDREELQQLLADLDDAIHMCRF